MRMRMNALGTGIGIGWRPELALAIDRMPGLDFVEVTADNVAARNLPRALVALRARGVPVAVHSIGLSLGGAEVIDPRRLDEVARLAAVLEAPIVSEHVAFVRAGGMEAGHLLPVPRTQDALQVIAENVLAIKARFPMPLALENIATLVDWPDGEWEEPEFLTQLLNTTGCRFLFDVSNLYANAGNHGWDSIAYLDRLPLERLAYVHIGGGVVRGELYHDTHAHEVGEGPLRLLEELCARVEPPGVMLERDEDFPSEDELNAELASIRAAIERGRTRRLRSDG
jgi:uncharacterized protein (UPF0276 family)